MRGDPFEEFANCFEKGRKCFLLQLWGVWLLVTVPAERVKTVDWWRGHTPRCSNIFDKRNIHTWPGQALILLLSPCLIRTGTLGDQRVACRELLKASRFRAVCRSCNNSSSEFFKGRRRCQNTTEVSVQIGSFTNERSPWFYLQEGPCSKGLKNNSLQWKLLLSTNMETQNRVTLTDLSLSESPSCEAVLLENGS